MPSVPTVAVVVPNRDGEALLPATLDALQRQTLAPDAVIVSDDGSRDRSAQVCAAHPLGPRFVPVRADAPDARPGEARGFGAAANAGIRQAPGVDYVALLNNDAAPEPGWLEALVAALEARPRFSFAASRVGFLYTPDLLESAGDAVAGTGQPYRRAHRRPSGPPHDRPVEVLSASAAAALYRRSLLVELGGFDESFFALYEDVDLCWRAFRRGHRGLYVPAARVRHRGGATLGRGERAYYLDQRNLEWLLFKNVPARTFARMLPGYLLHHVWSAWRALRRGRLGAWLRAKRDALAGLPGRLPQRSQELLETTISRTRLEQALDWGWTAAHLRKLLLGAAPPDAHDFGPPLAALPERLRAPDPATGTHGR